MIKLFAPKILKGALALGTTVYSRIPVQTIADALGSKTAQTIYKKIADLRTSESELYDACTYALSIFEELPDHIVEDINIYIDEPIDIKFIRKAIINAEKRYGTKSNKNNR